MTVASPTNKISYVGDGVSTLFSIPFPVITASDIKVYITSNGIQTLLSSNYSVDLVNARVTYPVFGFALNSPDIITLFRSVPLTQLTDYINQGAFNAEVLEATVDQLTMESQQINDQSARAFRLPVSEVGTDINSTLPTASARANKYLYFDASGNPTAVVNSSFGFIPNGSVGTLELADLSVITAKIANLAVTTAKIAAANITTALIANAAITTALIADANITTAKILDANITTAKIADLSVTNAKINDLDASKITAGLITVSRLNIQGIIMDNFSWTNNSPGGGSVAWSTGTLQYKGVARTISSGNTANKYIYWQLGTTPTVFQSSNAFPTLGDDDFLIATNIAGIHDLAWNNSNAAEHLQTADIAAAAVTTAKIANANITTALIANANITTALIANAAITTALIANAAITTALIADAQITTAKIVDANITTAKILDANITTAKIASANITTALIANAAITTALIADANITTAKIASAAITTALIASGNITTALIASLNVTTALIADGAITNAKINDLDASKITAGLLTVTRLNIQGIIMDSFTWTDNSPSGGSIAWSTGTLQYKGVTRTISSGNTSNKYIYWQLGTTPTVFQSSASFPTLGDDDFLIATNVSGIHDLAWNNGNAAQRIQTGDLSDASITTAKIVDANITTAKIASAAITTALIANAAITTALIADANITTVKILDANITTAKIANLAITNALVNDLSAAKITTGTLDASVVTISSTDGKMTLSGNILQIKNGSSVIQCTLGKYDGTNYGLAIGPTGAPVALMNASGITISGLSIINMKDGSDILFYSSTNAKTTQMGYVIDQFKIAGDSTKGVTIPLLTIGDNNNPSYGGITDGICITNQGSAASSDPTNAIVLWAENGALKYRGSAGARGVVVPPGVTSVSGTYSVALEDQYILCDATSAAFTVSLPLAAQNECRIIHIKKIDSSANAVTVGIVSSDDIEGVTTKSLATQFKSLTLYSNGSVRWMILAST